MTKKKGRSRFIFCCLAPAVILFAIFMLIPTIDVFRMSLYKWGGYTAEKTFVGLDNFKILLQSDKFYQAFQNSVLLIVIVTIVTFGMAIIFAAILTREKLKGQTFFRVVFYIPNILSVVVISAIFSAISVPGTEWGGQSYPLAWKSGSCYLQYYYRHGMAGHWILYGYVHGKYGKHSGQSL